MRLLSVLTLLSSLMCMSFIHAQERSRRDYHHLIADFPEQPDRSGKYPGHNVFLVNYNKNGDLMHITNKGKRILYVRNSGIGTMDDEVGNTYDFFFAWDENGYKVMIIIYHEEQYGIKIFSGFEDDNVKAHWHFVNLK